MGTRDYETRSTFIRVIRLNSRFHWEDWRRRLHTVIGRACRIIRIAVQFSGGLGGDLCNVEGDFLLLSAAFDGHGDVVRCLDGVENLLAALWVIECGAIDRSHQIAGPQPQLVECLPISTRIGTKAPKLSGRAVVRGYCAHDLIQ